MMEQELDLSSSGRGHVKDFLNVVINVQVLQNGGEVLD